jgi:hypothetical protein
MAIQSVDERLTTVESEVNRLKMRMEAERLPQQSPWWQKWFGAFKNDPDFDSAMERGVAYRRSQPTADEAVDDAIA